MDSEMYKEIKDVANEVMDIGTVIKKSAITLGVAFILGVAIGLLLPW